MWRLRVPCVPEDHKIKEENGAHPLRKKMGRRSRVSQGNGPDAFPQSPGERDWASSPHHREADDLGRAVETVEGISHLATMNALCGRPKGCLYRYGNPLTS